MARIARGPLYLVLLVLAGCSGSSTPPPKTGGPSGAGEPPDETAAPSTAGGDESADANEGGGKATAQTIGGSVTGISPSAESVPYSVVKIMFENPTPRVCTFTAYTVIWSGGKKRIEKPFTIPAGERRQRSVRVHPNDGDLATLTRDSAKVEIQSNCAP